MNINEQNTHILPEFEYHAPGSVEEAIRLLRELGPGALPLAGGTDLLVKMKQRAVAPTHVVNLKGIPGLAGEEKGPEGIRIGALTRLRDLERSGLVAERLPLLRETVEAMASVQIRNMATIGGNICNASPAADAAVTLITLGAEAQIAGLGGVRAIPLRDFFTGPGTTDLREGEILTSLLVPRPREGAGWAFLKLGRTSLDLATVNVASTLCLDGDTVTECSITLGAVAPTPLRVASAEGLLVGRRATPEAFKEAAGMCCAAIRPISDIRASAEYRMAASRALVFDALTRACGRAGGCA
jgi:CO/xanthine dehydrogenase FAD-binding subunit